MKRVLGVSLLVALLCVGCKQKTPGDLLQKDAKPAAEEIDFGKVENSTYTNDYFGMSIGLPKDWSVQDEEARKMITDAGTEAVVGEDKNLKAAVKASELQSVNLLAVFKHPLGSPVDFNPNFMCIAERVRHIPGIKKGKDYLFHAKKLLQSGQLKFTFPKEIYSETVGGVEFDVMEMNLVMQGMTLTQKQYATVRKGYALCFAVSYLNEAQDKELKEILKAVSFK